MLRYLALCLLLTVLPASSQQLLTKAEKTAFQETGRYEDMLRLCTEFQQRWPRDVRLSDFGVSPEGRILKVMTVSLSGTLEPEEAKKRKLPVVLIQACIHAGEVDGKDAGFMALRELLEKRASSLKHCVVVFVPMFNVDGHERFKSWNRPNQNGPREMGWRTTAQNLNLNRDYAKADASEMRDMLGLLELWDPIVYVDLHATDGAKFQADVAVLVEPIFDGADNLKVLGKALRRDLLERLEKQNWIGLPFYPSLIDSSNPMSGFADWAFTPRFSTGYWALRNRLTVLVETHSWKDYETRVKVTRDIILHLLELTEKNSERWQAEAQEADSATLAGEDIVLSHRTTEKKTMIDFPGYAYRFEDSLISGSKALVYDDTVNQNWRVPFFGEVLPKVVVKAPKGGYIIPPAVRGTVEPLLKHHGISFANQKSGNLSVDVFRVEKIEQSKGTLEGRQLTSLDGGWVEEHQSVKQGSLFVPIAQPKARLVMALLEPQAPDSLASWGFFNAYFEQKEYMERYVAEQEGKKMLRESPELKAEFEKRLTNDEAFRNDPKARLNFFYERHPSWDNEMDMYPIFRL